MQVTQGVWFDLDVEQQFHSFSLEREIVNIINSRAVLHELSAVLS